MFNSLQKKIESLKASESFSNKNRDKNNALTSLDYPALLGKAQWRKLHPAIKKRFSENAHQNVTYKGIMSEVSLSLLGKLFAQLCRLIGTPLALYEGKNVPMKVNVYSDEKLGGMTWDRFYLYQNKPVNRVRSTKCILPQEGLVEMIGYGFGMKLEVSENRGAIVFKSKAYLLKLGSLKIKLPDIITPGKTIVTQTAIDDAKFEFKLEVSHSWLGLFYKQVGVFKAVE